jgi:hypothetical protein
MTGIEGPANLQFQAQQPQGDQQPFHHQVPQSVNGNPEQPSFPPHTRQQSYPNQPSSGTPLSNIPERAIHAQPFQPYQQAGYQQPVFNGPQPYYYSAGNGGPAQYPQNAVIAPMFVPNTQQGGYLVPTVIPGAPQGVQQPPSAASVPTGWVAHEQNGMVYYLDPSQLYAPQEGFAQPNYTVPGMGGMMTPTPDGYYYPQAAQGQVYYPSQ